MKTFKTIITVAIVSLSLTSCKRPIKEVSPENTVELLKSREDVSNIVVDTVVENVINGETYVFTVAKADVTFSDSDSETYFFLTQSIDAESKTAKNNLSHSNNVLTPADKLAENSGVYTLITASKSSKEEIYALVGINCKR